MNFFFIIIYTVAVIGFGLVVFSGLIHIENLCPVLENGWMPVFKTFLVETITFPFGEMVVFTMFFPYVNDPKKVKMIGLGGMILAGINISIVVAINVAALGPDLFVRANFPLLATVSKIKLANFIERLDVLFMLYLVIGVFLKITLFFYAAAAGAADIFKFSDPKKLSFPLGALILFASVTISSNYAEHTEEGLRSVPIYLHWPFQIIIPTLLLIIALFRNRKKRQMRLKNQI